MSTPLDFLPAHRANVAEALRIVALRWFDAMGDAVALDGA